MVESVTVTVIVNAPCTFGVPVTAPLDESMPRPAGRPVADQVYSGVPPVATIEPAYKVPCLPLGRDVVVIATWAVIVIENGFVTL